MRDSQQISECYNLILK